MIEIERDAALSVECMPSAGWLTWWFEPWRYADPLWWNLGLPLADDMEPKAQSIVARRRAYRGWCERLGLPLFWTGPIDEAWCSISAPANAVAALRLLGAAVVASSGLAHRAPPHVSQPDWQWALQCASTGSLGKTSNTDDLSLAALEAIRAAVYATSPCLASRVMLVFPPVLVRGHRSATDSLPIPVARRVRRIWAAARVRSEEA